MLWNGPVLELDHARPRAASARTSSPSRPTSTRWSRTCAASDQARELGDALLDQRLVAGIGNIWKAEALWHARALAVAAARQRRRRGARARPRRGAPADARRARRPAAASARSTGARAGRARAAATPIRSRGQGDDNRIAYWCPGCQRGGGAAAARKRPRRGRARPAPLPLPALLLPRGLLAARGRRRGRRRAPVRVRGARRARAEPSLYEYRPLVRVVRRGAAPSGCGALDDARLALDELGREPAAAIFARAHAGGEPTSDEALLRTIVLAAARRRAEACGGFDWDDEAFDRAYAELERSLFGDAPHLRGRRAARRALARRAGRARRTGLRVRVAAAGELAAHWPEANGLLPAGFGREPDRLCVLELERDAAARTSRAARRAGRARRRGQRAAARDRGAGRRRPGAVRAARLAAARRSARCCRSPRPSRPGEPTRLDSFRARLAARPARAARRAPTRTRSSPRRSTAGSSRCSRPSRSARSSCARRSPRCSAAPTGSGRRRCGRRCCSARPARDRAEQLERLRGLARGETAGAGGCRRGAQGGSSRRSPTATAQRSSPRSTTRSLGVRPRPAGYFAALAS